MKLRGVGVLHFFNQMVHSGAKLSPQIPQIVPQTNRRNRAPATQKKQIISLSLKLSILRGSRTKPATASPYQYTQSAPDFI